MMSVVNQGEIDKKSTTTELPFRGIDSPRKIFEGKPETEADSRVWDGQEDVFRVPYVDGEMVVMEEQRVDGKVEGARVVEEEEKEGGSGSFGKVVLETRVSEDEGGEVRVSEKSRDLEGEESRKRVFSDAEVRADGGFREGAGLVGAERELTTYDCDSPSLESSELSGDFGGWMHGFETGDMVWGKVKSHPWWPGHIFNEGFASPSVRRLKRQGHVLVAFFGDNSYGWFDPAELIPFEQYFAEKSRQISSRNFVKAVEEATDEVSRRQALGLSCRCRNPYNFRPTSVPGYFSVDVVNSEFVGVYSMKQIKKARDGFVPVGVVSFVKQLAAVPQDPERGTMDWINNMAMLLALRKAKFEEFDETYAQAFGVEPIRPSRDALGVLEQPLNLATRAAPLSGPLVFAEALGVKRKSSAKSTVKATKDKAKKDKYLFKRRDDAPAWTTTVSPGPKPLDLLSIVSTPTHFPRGHAGASSGRHEAKNAADGSQVDEYVLQRRAPVDVAQGSIEVFPSDFRPAVADSGDGSVGVDMEGSPGMPSRSVEVKEDASAFDDGGRMDDARQEGRRPDFGGIKGVGVFDQKPALPLLAVDQANAGKVLPSGAVVKKEKKKKQRKEDGGPEPPDAEAKKKKKKRNKKEAGLETGADHPTPKVPKIGKDGEPIGKSAANSTGVGLPISEIVRPEIPRNEFGAGRPFDVAIPLPALDFSTQELDVPLLTSDLLALALDPFHGSERNASLFVRHVLLRFRSLVFQKSLVPIPPSEHDASQIQARKSEQQGMDATSEAEGRERTQPPSLSSKQLKHVSKTIGRPDDPTKSGRKRPPSERQEEKSVKKVKKLSQLKTLASDKKTGTSQKPTEGHAQEVPKDTTAAPAKASKADLSKKQDLAPMHKKQETLRLPKKQEPAPAPPKVPSPTFLFMKFPPRSTLPSIASMKVKFGRFGPLDLSGARVYWGSYTCKILFKYRADAQAAYMYARNNDVFGPVKVNYSLRDSEVPEPVKRDTEDSLQVRPGRGDDTLSDSRPSALKSQRQQVGQLKSCLKKPPGDDMGGSNLKETPRVKFMLDGEGGRREPSVVAGGNGNGGGNGLSSSLPPIDPNGKNSRSVNFLSAQPLALSLPITSHMISPPPPFFPPPRTTDMHPLAPPPLRFPVGQEHGPPHFSHRQAAQYNEGREGRGIGVDISHEMLSLLRRCSDIVTDVQSAFGHVPYHSQ